MDRCLQQTDDLMFAVILVITRVNIQMIFDTQQILWCFTMLITATWSHGQVQTGTEEPK